MVNPVIAACDEGFVPDRIATVTNPNVTATLEHKAGQPPTLRTVHP